MIDQPTDVRGSAAPAGLARRVGHLCLVLAAALTGCAVPPPTREPMEIDVFLASEGRGERAVVFLPGRRDTPRDFVDNAFLEQLRSRHPEVDVYIPRAHLGYYARRTIIERLHEDIFAPLRARGYRYIAVAGVSMGGLGALLYADAYPDNVDALALIAPYLGEPRLLEEIRAAGGPVAWGAARTGDEADRERLARLWDWFSQWPSQGPAAPVFLAYGQGDRFAPANSMLAGLLPEERTVTMAGGHRWVVWRKLWPQVLARGFISGESERTTARR